MLLSEYQEESAELRQRRQDLITIKKALGCPGATQEETLKTITSRLCCPTCLCRYCMCDEYEEELK